MLTLCVALRIIGPRIPDLRVPMSERVSKQATFKGLDALVQCLQRYVAENASRFDVREESDARGRVRTIVLKR